MSCCFHEKSISCCLIPCGFLVNLTEFMTRTNCDKYGLQIKAPLVLLLFEYWQSENVKSWRQVTVDGSYHYDLVTDKPHRGCDLKMRQTLLSRNKRSFDIQQNSCGNNGFYSHSQVSVHLHILTHNHTYSCRQTPLPTVLDTVTSNDSV